MDIRHKQARAAILFVCMLTLGGCGLFGGDDPSSDSTPIDYPLGADSQTLDLMRGAASTYWLYGAFPNYGFVPGGELIRLIGVFPNMANAQSMYTVYFGNNPASYAAMANAYDIYNVYVNAPPGDAQGLVDVNLIENASSIYTIYGPDAYAYVDPFRLINVDPPFGPVAGGNDADINGLFPVIQNDITSLATATNAYTVYFGSEIAPYRQAALADPIITNTKIYVTVPPKPDMLPGFVDVTLASSIYNVYEVLPNGYRYARDFELLDVIPDVGPFGGGNPVRLNGFFPTLINPINDLATANNLYEVYFGTERAAFDAAQTSLITASDMYVVAPRALAFGTVDVRILSVVDGIYNTYQNPIDDNYTYQRIMEIYSIYPNSGPLSGGNPVRIEGNFPVLADVSSFALASSMYNVFIDDNLAPFAGRQILPGPPPTLLYIEKAFGGVYGQYDILHVSAPAGNTIGLVDVDVVDLTFTDPPLTEVDGYEYTSDDTFGQWTNCEVYPNPVGPLRPGELYVRIEVSGSIPDTGFSVFIVPQGGNPADENHRIDLERDASDPDNSNQVWIGTNTDTITTIYAVDGTDTLYADGHAAVYLQENGNNIVGDDYSAPYRDGNRISDDAHEGRHFIIDTIPPVMDVSGTPGADFFVKFNPADYPNIGSFLPSSVALGTHPYWAALPIPTAFSQFLPGADAPVDDGVITDTPLQNPDGAQIFFNVASISNGLTEADGFNAPENNLQFIVDVDFVDQHLYDALGVNPGDSAYDVDRFDSGSSTARQVAGFGDQFIAYTGDQFEALQSNVYPETTGITSPLMLARWQLQPGSTRLPNINEIDVSFTPGNPVTVGNFFTEQSYTTMRARWDFANSVEPHPRDPRTGIEPENVDGNMHLIVKFAAADRATAYFTKGRKATDSEPPFLNMTEDHRLLDPLHLWWMREVKTEFIRNNVPGDGVTQAPSLAWNLASSPRPVVTENGGGSSELVPAYTYKIWRSEPSQNKDDYRDGAYQTYRGWTDWSAENTYDENFALEVAQGTLAENDLDRWYLIVVQGVDEAGNAESFPDELSISDIGLGSESVLVNNASGNRGSNWQRFYVPKVAETIETEATPFFWHDTDQNTSTLIDFDTDLQFTSGLNPAEVSFGSEPVLPLPPESQFFPVASTTTASAVNQRLAARFNVRVQSNTANQDTVIFWELYEDGEFKVGNTGLSFSDLNGLFPNHFLNQTVASIIYPGFVPDENNNIVVPSRKTEYLGDGNRVRPVNYLFRAWAATVNVGVDTFSVIAQDSTPVNIRFIVVPDVAEYVRNRQTDDEQPIKEFDRP